MIPRSVRTAGLIALLVLNTLSGAAKIGGFWHRHGGEKSIDAADFDSALTSLNAARKWQPGDAPTYVLIARAILLTQANGLPLRDLEGYTSGQILGVGTAALGRAIALNPADTWAWLGLADAYRGSRSARLRLEALRAAGDEAASVEQSEPSPPSAKVPSPSRPEPEDRLIFAAAMKAKELEPDFYLPHDLLAGLYWAKGMVAEAGDEIRKSFALMPDPTGRAQLTGEGFMRDLADPILEGIERASQNPLIPPVAAAASRAQILERLGRFPEAIEAYRDLARIGGEEYAASSGLAAARIHQARKEFRESIPLLDRVIEADPNGGIGTAALYLRGLARARLLEHGPAIDDLRKYLARRPGSAEELLTYADQLALAGDLAGAEKVYLGVVRKDPRNPSGYRRLVALLQRQRRWNEALVYAEMLRKIDPQDRSAEEIRRQSGGR